MSEILNGMRPIHPGEILREEFLLPLGLSANALAIALGVPAPRVNDIVRECGKRSMYWADVPLSHAELLAHIPRDMIALAWGYEPSSPFDSWAEKLCSLPQGPEGAWLCPGTSSWRSIAGRTTERRGNIAAEIGRAHV